MSDVDINIPALKRYFHTTANHPHALGMMDCVRFVTEAVYIGWGRDYRPVLQYQDRRSAVDRLRELGGLRGACNFAMGPMQSIEDLEAGDVIYFHKPRPTIGLLMPEFVLVKMGKNIHRLEIEQGMKGWKTDMDMRIQNGR